MNFQQVGVVFDCDSTLTTIEGIDELARDKKSLVEALTNQAMSGEVPLEAVYKKRLEIIRPTRQQIAELSDLYLANFVANARETVAKLQNLGVKVAICSGGLFPALEALAAELNVVDLFAVPMEFDALGNYADIPDHPLTTANGKAEIVRTWREKHQLNHVIMVGDGMSDAAAKAPNAADLFVAFTGVIRREKVLPLADVEIHQLDEIFSLIKK